MSPNQTTILLLCLLSLHHTASANEQAIIKRRRHELLQAKATLLAFKTSVTMPSPSVLADWDETNNDVCNFTGVLCNRWHKLIRLNLSNMHISGSIPPVVGNLTGLLSLDLSGNLFTGGIPTELAKLHRINELLLTGNQLSGPIPESLAALGSMHYLHLNQNHLSGPIPASLLRNCSLLGAVDLSDNALTGEIPSDGAIHLNGLIALDLYSNNLIGRIPRWLSNCTFLFELDLENNSLADELPTDIISDKKHLLYLHLANNRFWSHDGNTNLEPFFIAISNCSGMEEIEAGGIGLGGRLPSRLGSMLPAGLKTLSLEDNRIHGSIPPDIGVVINITLLNLSSNHLNGSVPASLCWLQMLERLDFSDNFLTGAIPTAIGNVTRLGYLDFSGNALSEGIPSGIGKLSHMNYIHLQRNRLSGAIPVSLGQCIGLLDLDLSSNSLTGTIPEEISGIVKISLNLSHNELQGPLPIGLSNMQQVQQIDLSSNNLIGAVIPQLSACVAVTLIDLSHNLLQGKLPDSFGDLANIESLDVSFNDLSGEIPQALSKCTKLTHLNLSNNGFSGYIPTGGIFSLLTNLSYIGNPHLCGQLIGRACKKHPKWQQSRKFLITMSICASVLAFILTICCFVSLRKLRERLAAMKMDMFKGGTSPVMKWKHPRVTYRELVEATDEFSERRLIGSGSYGRVYRGTLKDGSMVAVKVLQLQTGNSTKSFNRECQVLKRIRHRNLMRIVTACSLPDFKALVLPFMANGSLERCLYAPEAAELSLIQRVNICSDVAEGMAYLHHHSPVKVIHCDLKPSNVLINDNMTALVSDFGISRLVMNVGGVNTADVGASTVNMLCGSVGYIPPEYGYGSNPTTKGDVYSFGVLVLELVTKRKPTDDVFEGGLSLHKWVKNHYPGRAYVIVDPALAFVVRDQTPEVRRMWDVAIGELLELGMLCTQDNASIRPTMLDAADDLDRLKRYLGGDTTATFASSLGFSSTATIEDD